MTRNCPDCAALMHCVDPEDTPGAKIYECDNCFRQLEMEK